MSDDEAVLGVGRIALSPIQRCNFFNQRCKNSRGGWFAKINSEVAAGARQLWLDFSNSMYLNRLFQSPPRKEAKA
jgi:hypothetical protein